MPTGQLSVRTVASCYNCCALKNVHHRCIISYHCFVPSMYFILQFRLCLRKAIFASDSMEKASKTKPAYRLSFSVYCTVNQMKLRVFLYRSSEHLSQVYEQHAPKVVTWLCTAGNRIDNLFTANMPF